MATTKDVKIIQYGTATGHQPTYQPLTSAVSLYAGTVAVTRSGYLISPDTSVTSADYVWGIVNGIVDSNPAVSSPIVGAAANVTNVGISTGTFYLTPGTAGDALTNNWVYVRALQECDVACFHEESFCLGPSMAWNN